MVTLLNHDIKMSGEAAPCLTDTLNTDLITELPLYFETVRSAAWCKEHQFSNVALQFPDTLLAYAPQVARILSETVEHVHILADTNYGSCCVDEVAAQRLSTQAMVHYGHSCLSKVQSLPVLFVYGRERLDPAEVILKFSEVFNVEDRVVVMLDTMYSHCVSEIREGLEEYNVSVREPCLEQNTHTGDKPCEDTGEEGDEGAVFYVGKESLFLSHVILSNSSRKVVSYNPLTKELRTESKFVNKMLIKRYNNVEKVKQADIIGILVGTLGIKNFTGIINRLKQVITAGGKKWYVICIGKPNPAKLGNFPEISAFVLIGCVENSLLDTTEYFQAVVTPYELEIALIEREWVKDYITDSSTLLTNNYIDIPLTEKEKEPESMIVANLQSMSIATNYLKERSWGGLEQRLGLDQPAKLVQGQRGIAGYYENEPEPDQCSKMKCGNCS